MKNLRRYMHPNVATIQKSATVAEAARTLRNRHFGCLMVMDGDKLVGIVSERDIVYRCVAVDGDAHAQPVETIMTASIQLAFPEESLEGTIHRMNEGRFRHMPVVENDQLVGIVSQGDLVKALVDDQQFEIRSLTDYIRG